ncbi:hypothetical protein [Brevibacillus laterosporus]|uniref:hypothetical protein n=1 Tax=Brevibacillus laterosporus TaxID=1465 RepID=UPI002E1A88E9|nr:hypothetical protein [Brevibacillus laterosporus]MED1670316.1 hypothetical protein [Brevibacillus laterosporus]MED1717889.1 hypothetical protein [Brevibacillus laterosporus]
MGQNYVGLDLSTKTGFVRLNEQGNVLEEVEIEHKGDGPEPMAILIDDVVERIRPGDHVTIEGFGFSSMQGIQLGGIGWGVRIALWRKGIWYYEAAPTQVKKFATGKGNGDKAAVAVGIFEKFGFKHSSDNVRDAYVLAQIGRAINGHGQLIKTQKEVVEAILNPKPKAKAKAKNKA